MTIINNSTSAFFERSTMGMSGLRQQAETIQTQVSTGQKLAKSSDDPVAASKLRMLQRTDSFSKIDETNANRASTDLSLTDTALSSFADYVTQIRTLAVQAGSDTLSDSARAGITTQIQELSKNLVSLANSRDSSGHALFGGESAGNAYTVDASGNATYVGTTSAGQLPLGDGQSVTRGVTGPEFLNFSVNGTPTDLMAVVKNLTDALAGGSSDPVAAARDSLDALSSGLDAITTSQTVVGARMNWVDLTTSRRTNLTELRTNEEKNVGATDTPTAIARLQEVMLALEASQASFAKLSSLSLFNSIS